LKIGFNADATNWYSEDSKMYDWDGPKGQFNTEQLTEMYEKIIADHPLLEYMEDCFSNKDIQGGK
jgi:enolase